MLELHGVSRRFGTRQALQDVSFAVRDGRMTGFIGRNGAGKSTTMRIILGVLAPDTGEIHFNGAPVQDRERAQFGYMPEERGLYPKMKVREQLVYLAQLHGMSVADARESASSLLEQLELAARGDDKLEALSLGNQQRTQIAASLVHNPCALVLDEPFSGLDPAAVDIGVEVLRRYAALGVPVLFSSHQLDIVDRLCDDIVVIGDGRILVQGSKEEVREEHSSGEYEIAFRRPADAAWLSEIEGIHVSRRNEDSVRFRAANTSCADTVLAHALADSGITIESFARVDATVADILREVISR